MKGTCGMRQRERRKKKIKRFTYKMQLSLQWTFVLVIAIMVVLVGMVAKINIKDGDRYKKTALAQQTYTSSVIPYKRGDITDRNGTVLATSIKVYNLALDPAFILTQDNNGKYMYKDDTVAVLTQYFGYDVDKLEKVLNDNSKSRYYVYKKQVSADDVEGYTEYVKKYKKEHDGAQVKGVTFEEEYVRKYPLSTVGSSVVGFTYDKNAGNWGIEGYYNDELNGVEGKEFGYFDSELSLEPTVVDPQNGNTVVSTIDANVQRIVEENIGKFEKEMGGKTVAVMMADPKTGQILAMASSNGIYDLNSPRDLSGYFTKKETKAMSDKEQLDNLNNMWRNYCISDTYEPGSTFKPFVIAAGLEEKAITGKETYTCQGSLHVGGFNIHCAKRSGHGTLTIEQGIMYSCNVVLMNVAKQMGAGTFCKYQSKFGFGAKTGIDAQGEASGLVFTKEKLGPSELATSSFGQGLNVTMVQMVSAFSSLINGGNYYEPHVVKQILNDKGAVVDEINPKLVKQTVSATTSKTLRKYLYSTVSNGTATTAQVSGYTIGGKTGTAQKLPRGNGKYLVSFLGFASTDDEPQVVCYVIVDEPNTESQAHSTFAQQLFSDIMADSLPFLGVYPQGESHAPYYGQSDESDDKQDNKDDSKKDDENVQKVDSNGNPVVPAAKFESEDDYNNDAIEGDSGDNADDNSDDNADDNSDSDSTDSGDDNSGDSTGDDLADNN